jgi:hypothetical protein
MSRRQDKRLRHCSTGTTDHTAPAHTDCSPGMATRDCNIWIAFMAAGHRPSTMHAHATGTDSKPHHLRSLSAHWQRDHIRPASGAGTAGPPPCHWPLQCVSHQQFSARITFACVVFGSIIQATQGPSALSHCHVFRVLVASRASEATILAGNRSRGVHTRCCRRNEGG